MLNGEVIWHARQCDQLVRLFFNIWPTTTMKINPIMQKFCQVDSTFCQIRNKPSKICRRLLKFCQNGEISPNLVTLMPFTPLSKELHLHVTNKSFGGPFGNFLLCENNPFPLPLLLLRTIGRSALS